NGGIAFTADGRWLAWNTNQNGLCLFDTKTGTEVRRITVLGYFDCALAFSPDGRTLAIPSNAGSPPIRLYAMRTGPEQRSPPGQLGRLYAVEFTADGRLISAGEDNAALVWDIQPRFGRPRPPPAWTTGTRSGPTWATQTRRRRGER